MLWVRIDVRICIYICMYTVSSCVATNWHTQISTRSEVAGVEDALPLHHPWCLPPLTCVYICITYIYKYMYMNTASSCVAMHSRTHCNTRGEVAGVAKTCCFCTPRCTFPFDLCIYLYYIFIYICMLNIYIYIYIHTYIHTHILWVRALPRTETHTATHGATLHVLSRHVASASPAAPPPLTCVCVYIIYIHTYIQIYIYMCILQVRVLPRTEIHCNTRREVAGVAKKRCHYTPRGTSPFDLCVYVYFMYIYTYTNI